MYLFMVEFVIKVCLDFFSFLSCFFFSLLALVHPSLSFPMGKKRVIMRGSWDSKTPVTRVFYIYHNLKINLYKINTCELQ